MFHKKQFENIQEIPVILDKHYEKCPNTAKYGVFSGPCFQSPYSKISVFSPNAGKYGPEKTPYLDIFHTVRDVNLAT